MNRQQCRRLILFFGVLLSIAILKNNLVHAKVFRVNAAIDHNDLSPGNGLCVSFLLPIIPPFFVPYCTLRAAIEEANALPGPDIILLGSTTYRITSEGRLEDACFSGDLDIVDDLQIVGGGVNATFIDANGLDRVIDVIGTNTKVDLIGVTLINGEIDGTAEGGHGGGAGVRNSGALTLNQVVVEDSGYSGVGDNNGGGLLNKGVCMLFDSTIRNNSALYGGGIFNDSEGILKVFSSTINANQSQDGGGLINYGSIGLYNSTVSNNSGGGINNKGVMALIHGTIANNFITGEGGGINNEGDLSLVNTIVATNIGGDCGGRVPVDSLGNNLSSDATCFFIPERTDLSKVDPRLGPLQFNQGLTQTHALLPGSPAIDAGQRWEHITTDQQGRSRPKRKAYDIGAFEANNLAVSAFTATLLLP